MLWEPSPEQIERAAITRYQRWLAETRGLSFDSYAALWDWSVTEIEAFWESIFQFFQIKAHSPYTQVLPDRAMPGARWFPGATVNYTEHALARHDNHPAVLFRSETAPLRQITYRELSEQVGAAAAGLRRLGIGPGDRVAGYLPNTPEALIAFLATASIGAIWSCCSPDFGVRSVVDQIGRAHV